MIRLLILLVVIVLYFTFVIYNMEEKITLKYVMGLATQPLPVYLLVLGSLLAGMVLASILVLPGWIRMRMEMRRQRRTIEQMEYELNRLASLAPSKSAVENSGYTDKLEEV
jgi:uncharacterized membrane protein YciS (DUF1049 family)